MALVLKRLYHGYFWLFRDVADHRTDTMFLVSSPLVPLSICLIYNYFVYYLGPKLMENRKPFDITNIIRAYNVAQIVLNAYVLYYAVKLVSNMDWYCSTVDYSDSPQGNLSLSVAYMFYLLKILDLMDTIFFVLRKSYRQISFLHVYHHSAMVGCLWIGCRYVAGGTGLWIPVLNCLVHAVMYTYYLLATLDSKWKANKYKKFLTQLQLVQFLALLYIFARLLFIPECTYPKWISFLFVPQNFFMLSLFGDFYVKTYVRSKKSK